MKKDWIVIIVIVALVGLIGFVIYNNNKVDSERDERPEVGFYAPEFTLPNINDESISLSQYKGKPVFINFWASWCPPCKEEMPHIQQAYEKYGDRVVFISLNETYQDSKDSAIAFMKSNHYEMPILFDEDNSVTELYRANLKPTSYFIDKNGVIRFKFAGAMNYSQIEGYLEGILGD